MLQSFTEPSMTLVLVAILLAFTGLMILNAVRGKPSPGAEENIFVLGIISTSVSLAVSLSGLNMTNFQESMNLVLNHLVHALGINALALGCKFTYKLVLGKVMKDKATSDDANHLVRELSAVLRDNQEKADANTQLLVDALRESENSAAYNTQLLTDTLNENQEKNQASLKQLDQTLNNLAHKLAEEVLKSVQNLTKTMEEQVIAHLGKSFKELTVATDRLVVWQQQYKDELNYLQNIHRESATSLEKASGRLATMVQEAQVFTQVAHDLKDISAKAQQSHDQMVKALLQVDSAVDALKEVAPAIAEDLESLVRDIKHTSQQANQSLMDATDQLLDNTKTVSEQFKDTAFQLKNDTEEALDDVMRSFAEKVASILTHTINQSAEAHGLASRVAKDVERAKANGGYNS